MAYRNIIPLTIASSGKQVLVPYTSILSIHEGTEANAACAVMLISGFVHEVREMRLQLAKDLDVMIARNNGYGQARKEE